jgi:hypothetical protein
MASGIINNSAKHIHANHFESSQPLQVVSTNTFINVVKYGTYAFFVGSLLEYIMPHVSPQNEKRDVFILILEVLVQISIVSFSFMYLITFGGARLGLITFIIVVMACQPTLNSKINAIREKVFKINHIDPEEDKDETAAENIKNIANSKIAQKVLQPVVVENTPPPNVSQNSESFEQNYQPQPDFEGYDEGSTLLSDLQAF